MNPVFILLVLVGIVAIWFLLSFLYKPIGKLFSRIWQDSVEEIKYKDKKDEKQNKIKENEEFNNEG